MTTSFRRRRLLLVSALVAMLVAGLVPPSAASSAPLATVGTVAAPGLDDDHILLDAGPVTEGLDAVTAATATGGYALLSYAAYTKLGRTVRFYPDTPASTRTLMTTAVGEVNAISNAGLRIGTDTTVEYIGGEILVRVVPVTRCGDIAIGCAASTSYTGVDGRRYVNTTTIEVAADVVGTSLEGVVVGHELGHAMGLAHFEDKWDNSYQLMRSTAVSTGTYRAGDRRGLAALTGRVLGDVVGEMVNAQEFLGAVYVDGWTYDRDNPSSPVTVTATVDGVTVDSAQATPPTTPVGTSPVPNFSLRLSAEAGDHMVCLNAAIGGGEVRSLGCRTVTLSGAPQGALDAVETSVPGQLMLRGWASDPDTIDPLTVRVTIDGKPVSASVAASSRTAPEAGGLGGLVKDFSFVVANVFGGVHQVCASVDGVGPGPTTTALGCQSVTLLGGNPMGVLEAATQEGPRRIRVTGWTLDLDTASPVAVHVYVNGRWGGALTADKSRSDLGRLFTAYGESHGYSAAIAVAGGRNELCAYAINIGIGTVNTKLGCKTVWVMSGNPIGNFEALSRVSPTAVRLTGWTLDPDTTNAVAVHVYVNGRWGGAFTASGSRLDVGRAFAGYGSNHGMNALIGARPGEQVCAYAINQGSGTTNPLLGCRQA